LEAHWAANTCEPLHSTLAAEAGVSPCVPGSAAKTWARGNHTVSREQAELPRLVSQWSCRSLRRSISLAVLVSRGVLLRKPGALLITPGTAPLGPVRRWWQVYRAAKSRRSGNDARRRVAPIGAENRPALLRAGRRVRVFLRPQRLGPGDDLGALFLCQRIWRARQSSGQTADGV